MGRLIPAKGILVLLDAVKQLSKVLNFQLTILGNGPEAPGIDAWIKDNGFEGNIRRAGYCRGETLRKFYLDSDIFILPTWHGEGFPTVITEAMDAGLAVITTPVRGNCDYLVDKSTRCLFRAQFREII